MTELKGKRIILGLTGGIAVYKAASLLRRLTRDMNADVQVVMTDAALHFMTPLIFETFSGKKVLSKLFSDEEMVSTRHVDLVQQAELFLVAPATANIMAKTASAIGDDLLSTMLMASRPEKTCFAPAMNKNMYANPAFQKQLTFLSNAGYHIIEPGTGALATAVEGEGKGRLAEEEDILQWINSYFASKVRLTGKKVLISAGPTREYLDSIRFISNPSSGKMGIALARAAAAMGADVHLVYGPGSEEVPAGISCDKVISADEMQQALMNRYEDSHIVIMAAAVEDIRPQKRQAGKIKKQGIPDSLKLTASSDILALMGKRKNGQFLVGFSLEMENAVENSRKKLENKALDLIVINDPSEKNAAFSANTNRVSLLSPDGVLKEFPLAPKSVIARQILEEIEAKLA